MNYHQKHSFNAPYYSNPQGLRVQSLSIISFPVNFPYGVPGQVWYLIVSIPDVCLLYFYPIEDCVIIVPGTSNVLASFCS